jgi:SnoaL-like domain
MSATIVEKYFDTWNEQDAERRLALAEETSTPDARYVDPQADVSGSAGFSNLVASVHQLVPDHTFRLTSLHAKKVTPGRAMLQARMP